MLGMARSRLELAVQLFCDGHPERLTPHIVIALPVRDEFETIASCLLALERQVGHTKFGVVLIANNCRDATVPRAKDLLHAAGIPHLILPIELPKQHANAGFARGLALDVASLWAMRGEEPGVLLTTDADSRVEPDWLIRNLSGLSGKCGAVAGRFTFDDSEMSKWPRQLVERQRLESAYEDALAALSARLDPLLDDPWPNHGTESGASFALTLEAYRRVGGLPAVDSGEDRALAGELGRHDIAIRHDPAIVVTTSARFEGRAQGGCAEALLHRSTNEDAQGDERLEALPAALRRMVLRGKLRRAFATYICPEAWERRLLLDLGALTGASRRFGQAWAIAQARSPLLQRHHLRPAEMGHHLTAARLLLAALDGVSQRDKEIEPVIRRALLSDKIDVLPQRRDEALGSLVA